MADLKDFTRIYRNLEISLYVYRENEKIIRMVKEITPNINDSDAPKLYEEVQGWCEDWDEKIKHYTDYIEYMSSCYAHRKGMEEFIDYLVNHNETVCEHNKYFEEN